MKLIVKLFSGLFAVLLLFTAIYPLLPTASVSAAPSEIRFAQEDVGVVECQLTAEFGEFDNYSGDNAFFTGIRLIEIANTWGGTGVTGNLDVSSYLDSPHWYIRTTAGAGEDSHLCDNGDIAIFFQDPDDPTLFWGFQNEKLGIGFWTGPIQLRITNPNDDTATELEASLGIYVEESGGISTTAPLNVNISIIGATVGTVLGNTNSGGSGGSGGGGLPTTQYSWYWKDIATIERRAPRPGGSTVVETYTMERWGGSEHRYYLAQTTLPNRSQLIDGSGWSDVNGNTIDCRPYLSFSDDVGGLDLGFNDNQSGSTRFNNLRNALDNNSTGNFHDFTALEAANRCQDSGDDASITPGSNINKKIFFKYFPAENKITTILRANDGDNEQIYTGLYEYSNTSGRYDLKDSGCTTNPTRIEFTGAAPTATSAISANFRIRDVCADGTDIPVRIIAAISGEAPPTGTIGDGSDGGGSAVDRAPSCKSAMDNGFGWLICPVIDMADKFITWAEGAIKSKLEVNESFFKNEQLKEVWTQMARISSALLVMVGLFMVISTALGFDVVSSYTLKKVLPRMVIAAVGIWLSWALATTYVSFMNTLGRGIADLMYGPFQATEGVSFSNLDLKYIVSKSFATSGPGTDLVASGLIFTGVVVGIAGMTVFGILAAVVPVVGAIAIGLFVLALRESVIIFLVALAPLGVAAWILPNTNKGWKLWSGTFNKLLLMFPLFMGIFAAGKIFALITAQATGTSDGMLQIIIPAIAYVSPFFFLPALFKTAGGIFSNLTGMVNNRSKGLFDKTQGAFRSKADAGKKLRDDEKLRQAQIRSADGNAGIRDRYRLGAFGGIKSGTRAAYRRERAKQRIQGFQALGENEKIDTGVGVSASKVQLEQARSNIRNYNEGAEMAKVEASEAKLAVEAASEALKRGTVGGVPIPPISVGGGPATAFDFNNSDHLQQIVSNTSNSQSVRRAAFNQLLASKSDSQVRALQNGPRDSGLDEILASTRGDGSLVGAFIDKAPDVALSNGNTSSHFVDSATGDIKAPNTEGASKWSKGTLAEVLKVDPRMVDHIVGLAESDPDFAASLDGDKRKVLESAAGPGRTVVYARKVTK